MWFLKNKKHIGINKFLIKIKNSPLDIFSKVAKKLVGVKLNASHNSYKYIKTTKDKKYKQI